MTISSTLTLVFSMLILAATPGPGILLVTSQTATYSLRAGFLTTLGIICADIFFILLVTYGLATLAKSLESLIVIISFLGGLYLIFIGAHSLKKNLKNNANNTSNNSLKNQQTDSQGSAIKHSRPYKSNTYFLLSGFLITLSNPKAILFYLSFLPAFVNLSKLQHSDVVIIILTAIVTITQTMMTYAWMSNQATKISQRKQKESIISKLTAIMIIVVGCYMLYRSIY